MTTNRIALFFLILTTIQMVVVAFTPGGFNTPDEIMYGLMAFNMAEHGSFAIANGYEEDPVGAFVIKFTTPNDGAIYPQYPPFYPILAAPFYLMAGVHGLLALNALALLGIIWLTAQLAQHYFQNKHVTALAVLMSLIGSYLWVYSIAVWPHILSLLFIMLACWLHVVKQHALLAGIMLGVACGIRVDAVFALPAIILPYLFSRPMRMAALESCAIGFVLVMGVLSFINFHKFGTWLPFSYGIRAGGSSNSSISVYYLSIALIGAAITAWAWGFHRARGVMRQKYLLAGVITLLAGLVFSFIFAHRQLSTLLYGLWMNIVDIRAAVLVEMPNALERTPTGGVIYYGEFKRALLQSCPYFFLLFGLPLLWKKITLPHRHALLWLSLVPLGFIGVFSYQAWEGSFAYNMRYLLPVLPFLSIISAFILVQLLGEAFRWRLGYALAFIIMLAGIALLARYSVSLSLPTREWIANVLPWLLGCLLLVAGLCSPHLPKLQRFLPYIALPALCWGGTTTAVLHLPKHNELRVKTYVAATNLSKVMADDSVVIGAHEHFSLVHMNKRHFRMTVPSYFTDLNLRPFIEKYLDNGSHIYFSLAYPGTEKMLKDLQKWGFWITAVNYSPTKDVPELTPRLVEVTYPENNKSLMPPTDTKEEPSS